MVWLTTLRSLRISKSYKVACHAELFIENKEQSVEMPGVEPGSEKAPLKTFSER